MWSWPRCAAWWAAEGLLLEECGDVLAAWDEDRRRTGLLQRVVAVPEEDKVHQMAAAGLIEPSSGPWAAPTAAGWRFCVDHRRLISRRSIGCCDARNSHWTSWSGDEALFSLYRTL